MKIITLIFTVIKNFFLIAVFETKKFFIRPGKVRWIIILLVFFIAGGGFLGFRYFYPDPNDPDLSLSQAARIGKVTTHKLMVMIEKRNCSPEIASGCYERGDIVLIKPGDFAFSDAERTGFLILNMNITDKQAEVLVRSLEQKAKEQPKEKTPDGRPQMEQLKIRKHAVDLKKIGIGDDITRGKVMEEVFGWDVVYEKK